MQGPRNEAEGKDVHTCIHTYTYTYIYIYIHIERYSTYHIYIYIYIYTYVYIRDRENPRHTHICMSPPSAEPGFECLRRFSTFLCAASRVIKLSLLSFTTYIYIYTYIYMYILCTTTHDKCTVYFLYYSISCATI